MTSTVVRGNRRVRDLQKWAREEFRGREWRGEVSGDVRGRVMERR